MLYRKKPSILFNAGLFIIIVIFSSWSIIESSLSNSSLTVLSFNIALASSASNSTNINTSLISSNLTNTTIVDDSNGTLTTIPQLEDRRHAPLR